LKESTAIIFPNQLFEQSEMVEQCKDFIIVEEYLFFNQFKFHKQKILFHRISMKKYESYLLSRGKNVLYIDSFKKESDIRILIDQLNNVNEINIYEPVDDWLSRRILKHSKTKIKLNIHKHLKIIF
jgi:deoxyribodipyrimidine photolyase-related protein